MRHVGLKALEVLWALGPVTSLVAVPACCCNVRGGISTPVATSVFVLGGCLQQADATYAETFQFSWGVQPHAAIAVDAATVLTTEREGALISEICHV